MIGKVTKSRGLRPNLSMVSIPGMAKRALMRPKPKEARRAEISEKPAEVKMEAV